MIESNSLIGVVNCKSSIKLCLGRREDVEQYLETVLALPWNHPTEVHLFTYSCSPRESFDALSSYLLHHFRPTSFSVDHSEDNPVLSVSYRRDDLTERLYGELKRQNNFFKEEIVRFVG